jgi:hypothetical protein
MKTLEDLRTNVRELVVILDDIVRACFRLSFKGPGRTSWVCGR